MKRNLLRILWMIAAIILAVGSPILISELTRPSIEDYWEEIYYPENLIIQEDNGTVYIFYHRIKQRDYGKVNYGSTSNLSSRPLTEPYVGEVCSMTPAKDVFTQDEPVILRIKSNIDQELDFDTYNIQVLIDGTWHYVFSGGWGAGGQAALSLPPFYDDNLGIDFIRDFRTPIYKPETGTYGYGNFDKFTLWPGHYRVSITFSDFIAPGKFNKYPLSAEFYIVGPTLYTKDPADIEPTHPMMDYWVELFGSNSIGRHLSSGDYYLISHGSNYYSNDVFSLELSPDLHGVELFPTATDKDIYSPGETINVTIHNSSGAPFRMDAGDYCIDYLLDGKWYTIRPGEYSVDLLFDDLQIIEPDEDVTISVTPENLRQYHKVALDPETNRYEPIEDEPIILRPGRYRFALSIQTDADFDHLANSPEYLVGCEFEIE